MARACLVGKLCPGICGRSCMDYAVERVPELPGTPGGRRPRRPRRQGHVRTAKARVDAMLARCEAVDLIRHRRASSTNFTEAPTLLKIRVGPATGSVKGVFVEHQGLAWTPDRHVFQRIAALAQVNLTSQNVQHSAVRQHILFVASVCVCVSACVWQVIRCGHH